MRKTSIFPLVLTLSTLALLGATCQKTVTTSTTTNENTNVVATNNAVVNTNAVLNTNTAVNTNTVVNTNTTPVSNANVNTSVNTNTNANTSVTSTTVTFNGSSFSPSTVNISSGGTVTFVNNSSRSLQVSSNNHPTHTLNPQIGSGSVVAAGGTYSLTLTTKGAWGYHDHLNPSILGTIVVE